MKFIITENRLVRVVQAYFNKIITMPKFNWIDSINIVPGTTRSAGWNYSKDVPLYTYVISYNDDDDHPSYAKRQELYKSIAEIHNIIFPLDSDSIPSAYYSVEYKSSDE